MAGVYSHTHTWTNWNMAYTSTASSTTSAHSHNFSPDWVFTPGTGSTTTYVHDVYWSNVNTTYEETRDQKRERLFNEVVLAARTSGRIQGENVGNLPHLVDAEPEFQLPNYIGMAQLKTHNWRDDDTEMFKEMLAWIESDVERRHRVEDAYQRAFEEGREAKRRRQMREEERVAARRKAELLLISLLTHAQKEEWLEFRRVTEVAESGRVWRLFPEWSGGAVIMDNEQRRATLCVHPRERLPEEDGMVALLLALRSGQESRLIQLSVLHAGSWSDEEREIRATRPRMASEYNEGVGGYVQAEAAV